MTPGEQIFRREQIRCDTGRIKSQSLSVSTPTVIGNTSLPKRCLSYRWVIDDAQVFLKNINAADTRSRTHYYGSSLAKATPLDPQHRMYYITGTRRIRKGLVDDFQHDQ